MLYGFNLRRFLTKYSLAHSFSLLLSHAHHAPISTLGLRRETLPNRIVGFNTFKFTAGIGNEIFITERRTILPWRISATLFFRGKIKNRREKNI